MSIDKFLEWVLLYVIFVLVAVISLGVGALVWFAIAVMI